MPERTTISPEQRRQWVRRVIGCEDLTAAQKSVVLALETFSDYRDGSNAHPGEANLAEICCITTRAVRSALERGRTVGLIQQTAPANPRAARAAVYRIVVPTLITGTAVPVSNTITGTTVPVNNSTTGTSMSPSPEQPFLPSESFTKITGVSRNSGTSPRAHADAHFAEPPSRFCDNHPYGTRSKCSDCANARTAFDAWQTHRLEHNDTPTAANDFERRRRQRLIDNCPLGCDDFGRISGVDHAGNETLRPCDHGLSLVVAADG